MRLSRTLTKREGSTEAGPLPTIETEAIYGPWRVGLGYPYSWGGYCTEMGKLEGRGQPIRKQPWITLTAKGRRKKTPKNRSGPGRRSCQEGEMGCQRG